MGSASPCSASYVLLALIGFTGFFISPSLSLPAGRVAAPRATVVVPVLDICRTYVDGNEEITLYCKDGLSCGENDQGETKCFADVDPMSGQDSDGAGGEGMEEFEYFNNPQNEERAATEPERKSEPEKKQASPGGWDCESAGEYERLTSGWYYACAINKVPTRNSNYKPKIDPAELSRSAKQKCQGQGDFDACVGNAKQEMILAADPGIRDKCSGQSGMDFIVCVDQMYV